MKVAITKTGKRYHFLQLGTDDNGVPILADYTSCGIPVSNGWYSAWEVELEEAEEKGYEWCWHCRHDLKRQQWKEKR